jgi:hypothetical protein
MKLHMLLVLMLLALCVGCFDDFYENPEQLVGTNGILFLGDAGAGKSLLANMLLSVGAASKEQSCRSETLTKPFQTCRMAVDCTAGVSVNLFRDESVALLTSEPSDSSSSSSSSSSFSSLPSNDNVHQIVDVDGNAPAMFVIDTPGLHGTKFKAADIAHGVEQLKRVIPISIRHVVVPFKDRLDVESLVAVLTRLNLLGNVSMTFVYTLADATPAEVESMHLAEHFGDKFEVLSARINLDAIAEGDQGARAACLLLRNDLRRLAGTVRQRFVRKHLFSTDALTRAFVSIWRDYDALVRRESLVRRGALISDQGIATLVADDPSLFAKYLTTQLDVDDVAIHISDALRRLRLYKLDAYFLYAVHQLALAPAAGHRGGVNTSSPCPPSHFECPLKDMPFVPADLRSLFCSLFMRWPVLTACVLGIFARPLIIVVLRAMYPHLSNFFGDLLQSIRPQGQGQGQGQTQSQAQVQSQEQEQVSKSIASESGSSSTSNVTIVDAPSGPPTFK